MTCNIVKTVMFCAFLILYCTFLARYVSFLCTAASVIILFFINKCLFKMIIIHFKKQLLMNCLIKWVGYVVTVIFDIVWLPHC